MQYFILPYTKTNIQKQFRELSKRLHPDKKGGNETEFKKMVAERDQILQAIERVNLQFPERKPRKGKKAPYTKRTVAKTVQMRFKYLHVEVSADEFFDLMHKILTPM